MRHLNDNGKVAISAIVGLAISLLMGKLILAVMISIISIVLMPFTFMLSLFAIGSEAIYYQASFIGSTMIVFAFVFRTMCTFQNLTDKTKSIMIFVVILIATIGTSLILNGVHRTELCQSILSPDYTNNELEAMRLFCSVRGGR